MIISLPFSVFVVSHFIDLSDTYLRWYRYNIFPQAVLDTFRLDVSNLRNSVLSDSLKAIKISCIYRKIYG